MAKLVEGATEVLSQYSQVSIVKIQVPGCVEIPFAINTHYKKHKADAYIALGCVIRGGTPHFDYVCDSVTQGITTLNTSLDSPVIFGILTVNNEEQAYERLGGIHGHKGKEVAIASLKMISLKNNIISSSK
jgi:6,7-dimethyl-8-ribityllumazine synthase